MECNIHITVVFPVKVYADLVTKNGVNLTLQVFAKSADCQNLLHSNQSREK